MRTPLASNPSPKPIRRHRPTKVPRQRPGQTRKRIPKSRAGPRQPRQIRPPLSCRRAKSPLPHRTAPRFSPRSVSILSLGRQPRLTASPTASPSTSPRRASKPFSHPLPRSATRRPQPAPRRTRLLFRSRPTPPHIRAWLGRRPRKAHWPTRRNPQAEQPKRRMPPRRRFRLRKQAPHRTMRPLRAARPAQHPRRPAQPTARRRQSPLMLRPHRASTPRESCRA